MAEVLVTGGTGVLGHEVALRLLAAGHVVRVLSRREGARVPAGAITVRGDLDIGAGLAPAVAGANAIVHCASATKTLSYRRAHRTDVDGTKRLVDAADPGTHLVYISIVGIDRIRLGYYRAKLECEQLIEASGVPWTTLRTTQFHTLLDFFFTRAARLPVLPVPAGVRVQPIDAGEVADRLVELALGGPAGRVDDMGGPEVRGIDDLARAWARVRRRRRVIRFPFLGPGAAAFRAGENTCPDKGAGKVTWEQYLRRGRT